MIATSFNLSGKRGWKTIFSACDQKSIFNKNQIENSIFYDYDHSKSKMIFACKAKEQKKNQSGT